MDRYPCVNRYKHGVDCPGWVNVHNARCEDLQPTIFEILTANKGFKRQAVSATTPRKPALESAARGHASAEIERKKGYHPHRISLQPASMLKEWAGGLRSEGLDRQNLGQPVHIVL
ncbi:hypothetical protein CDEST_06913 [Colletotrichum destructivum]|uniref:Uncharacterized protein n=1 Tax=Colletotrichum destructivum TaxID=34406 RepID=A0AAX4IF34_9PEZI|nr:hypothetical protein CDEST_06913 [Colletotrichum destructivum]